MMNLHRVEGQADWQKVEPEQWNIWQKAAGRTGGIITVGNFFSLLGLLSVPYGLLLFRDGYQVTGVVVLALGRLCDLLDGWLADKTGTKSPLGEKIDASFDKISTGLVLVGLVVLDLIAWPLIAVLIAAQALIAVLALAAFARGKQFHPSRIGKLSMAAIWLTIIVFLTLGPLQGSAEDKGRVLALIVFCVSMVLGLAALAGYISELFKSFRKS